MNILLYVIPASLVLSLGFLFAFIWAIENDQIQDLEENARSILDKKSNEEERTTL